MNIIDHDDPRLTAYALNELEGDERAAFEALLKDDPAAQAEVEAIRAFGGTLAGELQKAPCPVLTGAQRAKVVSAATPIARLRPWFLRPEALAAAGLVGAIGLGLWSSRVKEQVVVTIEGSAGAVDGMWMDQAFRRSRVERLEALVRETRKLEAHQEKLNEELREARLLLHGRENDEVKYDHFKTTVLDPASTKIPEILELEYAANEDWKNIRDEAVAREWRRLHPVPDNPFKPAAADPLSTFSIDVDTAAYANVRRYLQQQSALPPREAVRLEELINYFPYDYAQPTGEHPFAANVEVASCPWAREHRLVRVGLKGREQAAVDRPATNLVFLIDVSGSMSAVNKLPLVKRSLELLVGQLRAEDRVAIVVYAGASGVVLESTPGDRKADISDALERLSAGGSTNGGAGIQLAYDLASRHFAEGGGVNRVVLCTDGDWNVGVQSHEALQALIEEKARSRVFLTVLGFGMSHADTTLELLADKGNGNYAFVDTIAEARKVLVDQLSSTLVTIAKDVKVQVEWDPAHVASYRLIGYENRVMAARDFADDTKDAGEIGAGHTVTALYEVVPTPAAAAARGPRQLMTLRLRYKQPLGDVSRLLEQPAVDAGKGFDQASPDFRFAAGVATFGLVLRDSPHKGTATLALAHELTRDGVGKDPHGLRGELVALVKTAATISGATLTLPPPPRPAAPVTPVAPVEAKSPVLLESLDDRARMTIAGEAAHLPDGTLLHVRLHVDRDPPVEAAFYRVEVKGGRYAGGHEWAEKSFAPLAYRTDVTLIMEVQSPAVKRFLARELGYTPEHVEVIEAVRTVVGSDDERRAFEVQTLQTLRELQQRASALLAELQLASSDELLPRLRQAREDLGTLEKTRVVWFDADLFATLGQALSRLERAARKPEEAAVTALAGTEQDLRRVLEAIDSRLP